MLDTVFPYRFGVEIAGGEIVSHAHGGHLALQPIENIIGPVGGTTLDDGESAILGTEEAHRLDDSAHQGKHNVSGLIEIQSEEILDLRFRKEALGCANREIGIARADSRRTVQLRRQTHIVGHDAAYKIIDSAAIDGQFGGEGLIQNICYRRGVEAIAGGDGGNGGIEIIFVIRCTISSGGRWRPLKGDVEEEQETEGSGGDGQPEELRLHLSDIKIHVGCDAGTIQGGDAKSTSDSGNATHIVGDKRGRGDKQLKRGQEGQAEINTRKKASAM